MRRRGGRLRNTGLDYNTLIGGMAATFPTKASLASTLGITEGNISYFNINGSDVQAKINVTYNLPEAPFKGSTALTKFEDLEGKLLSTASSIFQACSNLRRFISTADFIMGAYTFRQCTSVHVELVNITVLNNLEFYNAGLSYLDIRKVTDLGGDSLDNNMFEIITGNPTIYVNSVLATSNNGGMEGDLVDAQNRGATIIFV